MLLVALGAISACGSEAPPSTARQSDIALVAEAVTTIEERVPLRGTLDTVLHGHGIDSAVVPRVITAVRSAFNPRALRAGQPYRVVLTADGIFQSFEYAIDRDRFLRVEAPDTRSSDPLTAEILDYPMQRTPAVVTGVIDAERPSLFAAVDHAGEHVELALLLADVFGGQVDFNSDLQPGDRFEALVEKKFHDGEFSGYGDIAAATLVNGGRRLQAFRFMQADGTPGYFDEQGRSVRRLFLPSPLPFDPRVTSRFSRRRAHPVDGVPRAHLGVDYAAAIGTPVLAVADGVVVSAGFSGASGRLIRLRHANGYETYYLHLSSFARKVRAGARVAQGEIIGRVGASGRVTGPHLDYRIARNGVFVDPLLERRRMPGGDPVSRESMAMFERARDDAVTQLVMLMPAPAVLAARSREPDDSSRGVPLPAVPAIRPGAPR